MHCKGMNFTDFLLHCKGSILKADFFAAHTVSRQTQCPPGENYYKRSYSRVPNKRTVANKRKREGLKFWGKWTVRV